MAMRGPEAAMLTVIPNCKTEPNCSTTYTSATDNAEKLLLFISSGFVVNDLKTNPQIEKLSLALNSAFDFHLVLFYSWA